MKIRFIGEIDCYGDCPNEISEETFEMYFSECGKPNLFLVDGQYLLLNDSEAEAYFDMMGY